MSGRERRRYGRTESLNLLDNIVLGETGEMVAHQMGRTINISENGLMLETHVQFKPKHLLIITIALGDSLVEIKGLVRHVEPSGDVFRSGIEFVDIDDDGKAILKKYLDSIREEDR
ncbi:MAG TPA: PilZ domain-containing protein [Geobacteraceae bacterium]|nr:PilZ domain-containing protein [Geobacteraceae bacterium]